MCIRDRYQIKLQECDKEFLTKLVGGVSHQGCVIELGSRKYFTAKDQLSFLAKRDEALILAVDELYDPQNLGSILRAAECFKVDGIMWSKNRGVGVTPAVSKISVGASEVVPLIPVSNLRTSLELFRKEGFEVIVADGGEGSSSIYDFDFPKKSIFVMGSEGKGVQPLIRKEAEFSVKIPMLGDIDSLNVAQASAVFLAFCRKR